MNYTEKRRLKKIQVLEREIEYYKRVYKRCNKLDKLLRNISKLKKVN